MTTNAHHRRHGKAATVIACALLVQPAGSACSNQTPTSTPTTAVGLAKASVEASWAVPNARIERFEASRTPTALLHQLSSTNLDGITHFDLNGRGWGPPLGKVLGESSALEHVVALDVGNNALRTEGTAALLESEHLGALRALDLGGNDLRDPAARLLANAESLRNLQVLSLSGNSLSAAGVRALAPSSPASASTLADATRAPWR